MEEFLKAYGFLILMMMVCVGSHFFMHGKGRHKSHNGHGTANSHDDSNKGH